MFKNDTLKFSGLCPRLVLGSGEVTSWSLGWFAINLGVMTKTSNRYLCSVRQLESNHARLYFPALFNK